MTSLEDRRIRAERERERERERESVYLSRRLHKKHCTHAVGKKNTRQAARKGYKPITVWPP